jgi:hypothetical protein
MIPSWKISKDDLTLLSLVCDRVEKLRPGTFDRQDLIMDLNACHSNGCPLNFARMLDAPEFDFFHDIYGINRHLDRETGALKDCFSPRCSA